MTEATRTRKGSYQGLFSVRLFRALFISRSLMIVTETMKALAVSPLVFERTGSSLLAAAAYMAGIFAYLLGGMLLLSLADIFSARLILVSFHLFRLGVIGSLAVSVIPVPIVLVLAAATGVFGPVVEGSAASLLSNVLSDRHYVAGRALFSASAGAAQIVGQGLAGVLFVALSPHGVLTVAAGICLIAAGVSWLGLRGCPESPRRRGLPDADAPSASPAPRRLRLSAAKATWRINKALIADRGVRGLLLAQLVPCSLITGAEGAVVPYTAGMGPSSAGLMFTAITSGMLVGSLLVGRFAGARSERLVQPLVFLAGCGLILFVLSPDLTRAVPLIGVSSVGLGYGVGLQERFLKALPDKARGQAFGLLSTGMLTGQALTIFAAGALAGTLEAGLVMAVFGFLVVVSGLVLTPYLRPARSADTR